MIVVSGSVAVVLIVLGVLAYILDGIGRARRRAARKTQVGSLYEAPKPPDNGC